MPSLSCQELTTQPLASLKTKSAAFNSVANKAIPAVVNISTTRILKTRGYQYHPFYELFGDQELAQLFEGQKKEYKKKGLGSGVIVSKKGYILTNNHVIDNVDEITITLSDGTEYAAKIIGKDPKTDIAVLKIQGNTFPYVEFSNSDNLKVGDWAIAVGSPFGYFGTVTVGIISAKGRTEKEIVDYTDLIQTDAAINPGNSGGALLNIDGELIGINTAIVSRSGGYMGIGFAIPANTAQRIMEDFIQKGEVIRGWLGITIQDITPELQKEFNLKRQFGAIVSSIIKDSPADKAGLKRGDIIIKYNDKKIKNTRNLRNNVADTKIGQSVPIFLLRNHQSKTIYATIKAIPKNKTHHSQGFDKIGFKVKEKIDNAWSFYNFQSSTYIEITDIDKNCPAYKKGVRTGDIILEINHQEANSLARYQQILKKLPENKSVLLVIFNNGYSSYLVIPPYQ
jgi:serine protease Do